MSGNKKNSLFVSPLPQKTLGAKSQPDAEEHGASSPARCRIPDFPVLLGFHRRSGWFQEEGEATRRGSPTGDSSEWKRSCSSPQGAGLVLSIGGNHRGETNKGSGTRSVLKSQVLDFLKVQSTYGVKISLNLNLASLCTTSTSLFQKLL